MLKTIAAAALLAGAVTLGAQAPKKETQAQMRKQAKVTLTSARATALKEVPNGHVAKSQLERENGKLVYSFDVKVPGKSGWEEVNVDAATGTVVSTQHETPKMEAKEKQTQNKKQ